jgi:hypothetical protein
MEEVLGAKNVMQQSLFVPEEDPMAQALMQARQAMLVAISVAGVALVAALVALGVVLLR